MLTAISGKPGAGKTYFAAYLFKKYVDQGRYDIIFSNFDINYQGKKAIQFYSIEDFISIGYHPAFKGKKKLIIMDEAYYLIDSKNWRGVTAEMTTFLRQHRKKDTDIIAIVQDWKNLHIDFRRLVNDVYYARPFLPWLVAFINFFLLRIHYTQDERLPFKHSSKKPVMATTYEYYPEVSENQKIPYIKNAQALLNYSEGKGLHVESPDQTAPTDRLRIWQSKKVREIFSTSQEVALIDEEKLKTIFEKSEMLKRF